MEKRSKLYWQWHIPFIPTTLESLTSGILLENIGSSKLQVNSLASKRTRARVIFHDVVSDRTVDEFWCNTHCAAEGKCSCKTNRRAGESLVVAECHRVKPGKSQSTVHFGGYLH